MIYSLYITKDATGIYTSRVCVGSDSEPIIEFESDTISNAIRGVAEQELSGVVGFHIWYRALCLGTIPVEEMLRSPESLAERAVKLKAMFSA